MRFHFGHEGDQQQPEASTEEGHGGSQDASSTCLKRLSSKVCARGQRAKEVLNITAGSQSISPFYWAIASRSKDPVEVTAKDSGALVCAQTILEDLLTIRADRDAPWNTPGGGVKTVKGDGLASEGSANTKRQSVFSICQYI